MVYFQKLFVMRKKITSVLLFMLIGILYPFADVAHANVNQVDDNGISAKRIGGVSLASSIYKTHNEQGEVTGDGDVVNHIGEIVGSGEVIFGNGSVPASQYADLSEYDYMIVQGEAGSELCFMVNRNADHHAEYTYTIGASEVLKIDFQEFFGNATVPSDVRRDCFHLNCIIVPEGTAGHTINFIDLFKNETPVMYELTGTGEFNASAQYALNDAKAVFYDATSFDNSVELNPVNFNAMISAKQYIVEREEHKNIIENGECNGLKLYDKKPFLLANTLRLGNPACFTMWMTDAGMATIVLPFDAMVPDGVSAYKVVSVDGDEIWANKCESIKKNEPMLIVGGEGEFIFYGFQEDDELPATTGDLTCGLLVGTYQDTEVPDGSYLLQNHSGEVGFYRVNEDMGSYGLKPFHAYLSLPSPYARFINIHFDDSAAAIAPVKSVSDAPRSAFNFLGQEVMPHTKGLVIVNGMKVYNK